MDAARRRLWLVTGAALTNPAGPTDPNAASMWGRTLAQLPLPVAVYDLDARLVAANEVMTRVMGRTEEEMRGLTLWEIEPSWPFDEYDRLQREVLRTGEMIFHEQHGQAPGETREHAWSMFLSPLKDENGTVHGLSATVFDTTEQYWARQRLAVLNDASLRIGSTLDVTRTAEELAEVAVTGFADFVTVDLLESVAQGEEPRSVPPGESVTVRRAAQPRCWRDARSRWSPRAARVSTRRIRCRCWRWSAAGAPGTGRTIRRCGRGSNRPRPVPRPWAST
ncbi:PAS domain-containing protein [Streptomyces mirabilis]|nr:PAS domain-containing protein [Streptomyces mirabilis]